VTEPSNQPLRVFRRFSRWKTRHPGGRSRLTAFVVLAGVAACGSGASDGPGAVAGEALKTPFAETFSVVERNGYRVVDIEASIITWGGSAGGPPQRARLVLVPRGLEPPALTGDLAGASLIRTPVRRIGRGPNHGRESANYLQGCTICVSCRWTGHYWTVPRERENRNRMAGLPRPCLAFAGGPGEASRPPSPEAVLSGRIGDPPCRKCARDSSREHVRPIGRVAWRATARSRLFRAMPGAAYGSRTSSRTVPKLSR